MAKLTLNQKIEIYQEKLVLQFLTMLDKAFEKYDNLEGLILQSD